MQISGLGNYRFWRLGAVESTNARCLAAARSGEAGGLWISASRQTAGRGSRGREWASFEGNLFASLLLDEPGPLKAIPELAFVISLAVHDSLSQLAAMRGTMVNLELKWPNDVLLDGRKVCGILLESHELDGRRIVIVGIGVNCAGYPTDAMWPATDLQSSGLGIQPVELLELIAGFVEKRIAQWQRGGNFSQIRDAWKLRSRGIGEALLVRLPNRQIEGIFEDLDATGRLLLRKSDGSREEISAADIFQPLATNGAA